MSDLNKLFEGFNQLTVLVIGDVMIDSYLWGKADRISPEAPVPVVNVRRREKRPGGAANVALNLQALGAQPLLCSVVGTDPEADDFLQLLEENKLSTRGILCSPERVTTIKHRILSGTQQLLRVDSETDAPLNHRERSELIEKIKELIPKCHAIIFEDYDKGVIDEVLIAETVAAAHKAGKPVAVDPKKRNFDFYKNVTLFKPNLKELKEGLKIEVNPADIQAVATAVEQLKQQLNARGVMLTLSEYGVYIDMDRQKVSIAAHKRTISDVSGAGDTVISVAALCLALNTPPQLLAALSNLAGGLVCEHPGVVPINKETLLREALSKITL